VRRSGASEWDAGTERAASCTGDGGAGAGLRCAVRSGESSDAVGCRRAGARRAVVCGPMRGGGLGAGQSLVRARSGLNEVERVCGGGVEARRWSRAKPGARRECESELEARLVERGLEACGGGAEQRGGGVDPRAGRL
jgi:hypothetical protein